VVVIMNFIKLSTGVYVPHGCEVPPTMRGLPVINLRNGDLYPTVVGLIRYSEERASGDRAYGMVFARHIDNLNRWDELVTNGHTRPITLHHIVSTIQVLMTRCGCIRFPKDKFPKNDDDDNDDDSGDDAGDDDVAACDPAVAVMPMCCNTTRFLGNVILHVTGSSMGDGKLPVRGLSPSIQIPTIPAVKKFSFTLNDGCTLLCTDDGGSTFNHDARVVLSSGVHRCHRHLDLDPRQVHTILHSFKRYVHWSHVAQLCRLLPCCVVRCSVSSIPAAKYKGVEAIEGDLDFFNDVTKPFVELCGKYAPSLTSSIMTQYQTAADTQWVMGDVIEPEVAILFFITLSIVAVPFANGRDGAQIAVLAGLGGSGKSTLFDLVRALFKGAVQDIDAKATAENCLSSLYNFEQTAFKRNVPEIVAFQSPDGRGHYGACIHEHFINMMIGTPNGRAIAISSGKFKSPKTIEVEVAGGVYHTCNDLAPELAEMVLNKTISAQQSLGAKVAGPLAGWKSDVMRRLAIATPWMCVRDPGDPKYVPGCVTSSVRLPANALCMFFSCTVLGNRAEHSKMMEDEMTMFILLIASTSAHGVVRSLNLSNERVPLHVAITELYAGFGNDTAVKVVMGCIVPHAAVTTVSCKDGGVQSHSVEFCNNVPLSKLLDEVKAQCKNVKSVSQLKSICQAKSDSAYCCVDCGVGFINKRKAFYYDLKRHADNGANPVLKDIFDSTCDYASSGEHNWGCRAVLRNHYLASQNNGM
jgi:hypothetical protein